MAVTRSPSALLGILAQTRAKGPLTTFSLSFVMLSDVVVILVAALTMGLSRVRLRRPRRGPAARRGSSGFTHGAISSVALGVTLGILLAVYLRLVGGQLLVVLIGLGLGLSELLRYIEFDALLAFIVAGFVVENFSSQGPKLHASVSRMSTVVFVIFFALAGAHLDIAILKKLWPVALALAAARTLATVGSNRLSTKVARDEPFIRRWGWSSMISQSGVTLGLTLVIVHTFPNLSQEFAGLVIAVLSLNQLVGPVVFKLALDRTGESARMARCESWPNSTPKKPGRRYFSAAICIRRRFTAMSGRVCNQFELPPRVEVELAIFYPRSPFSTSGLATMARRMRRLGMSFRAIGAALGVDEKQVRKSSTKDELMTLAFCGDLLRRARSARFASPTAKKIPGREDHSDVPSGALACSSLFLATLPVPQILSPHPEGAKTVRAEAVRLGQALLDLSTTPRSRSLRSMR